MNRSDAISILQLYGLDEVLTEEDDPRLWAAALAAFWPRPGAPNLNVVTFGDPARFCFGTGYIPDKSEKARGASALANVESWVFERVDHELFRATRGEVEYPHFSLALSRPSVGTEVAWVTAAHNPAFLVGDGVTTVWVRQGDGSWIGTSEVIDAWRS